MVEQVGGDHYKAEYQHWDWVPDTGLGYLEATATKYLPRWRVKGGIQDLKKALSYIDKLHLQLKEKPERTPCARTRPLRSDALLGRYIESSKMDTNEVELTSRLDCWEFDQDLLDARDLLLEMIVREERRLKGELAP